MRFRLLNPHRRRARHLGVSLGVSLCAGALLVTAGPRPVFAAPTLGGDENGPQVQIVQPGYQDVLKGRAKIIIAVKAQKFNPQFVEMFIDDKPATNGPIPLAALASAEFDWPTTQYTDGPHKLTVRVTDTQGFRGWAEVNVYVNNDKKRDTAPPSLEWLNVNAYQQISGTAKIELQALDNFGVKWIMVSVNPASDPNRKPALRSWLLNKPPYVVEFDSSKVPDGLYSLSAKAWDAVEQEGEAASLTVGVINNGDLNATTVGEMLRGMKAMEKPKMASLPAKTPVAVDATSRTARNNARTESPAPSPRVARNTAPATPVAPRLSTRPAASTARVVPPASPATLANNSTPKREAVSRAAAPEMAPRALSRTAKPQIAPPRLAASRAASPSNPLDLAASLEAATLSAAGQSLEPRVSRRELETGALRPDFKGIEASRVAMPAGETRALASNLPETPAANPAWSQNGSSDATRLALNAPTSIEAPEMARTGRVSGPQSLAARGETNAPALSTPTSGTASRVAPQVAAAPAIEKTAPAPSRLAAPQTVAPQTVAPGKVAPAASNKKTRVAALPRPAKPAMRGAITAITVSPLEVKTSDAIPAFHVAARATDLRAVAARYGLPVEVVAACNDWNSAKKLVAGEKVKLPTQLKVSYQGVPVESDAPSMLVGGTGVTAFRFLFEKQGGKLLWDPKKQRVTATKGDNKVMLTIGSKTAKVGEKDVMMELAAFLFEGRTMIPVRFFEEGLNAQVEWDPQTGRLVVAMAG
ncbi:MAG: hypothetical protein KY445_08865 [Armatimonadetes bacterium]|nr:hypothetical protein [Armatimonadota bacterium]